MKSVSIVAAVVCLLVLHRSPSHAQSKEGGLLAPPYPGSFAELNPGIPEGPYRSMIDARSRTYYAKDPLEKVKAHYAKLLGPFEEYSPSYIYTHDVIPFKDVVAIVEKRGARVAEGGESFFGGAFAGVTLSGKTNNNAFHYSVVKVFEKLDGAYLKRFQEADAADPANLQKRLEAPELKQLKGRYEHLKWSYFAQTAEKRKDRANGYLSKDEALFEKHFTAPEEIRTKELAEVQRKMTEASAKMRYEEAGKLGDRMMKLMQPDPKEEWNAIIKCLEEMETHAYATKIVIDMHPTKWDLTPPKN